VIRTQIVQEGSVVHICVVPAPGFSDADREQLLGNARRKLPQSMTADVATVSELRRGPRGKIPFVIRDR
jgi:hypothetical protein